MSNRILEIIPQIGVFTDVQILAEARGYVLAYIPAKQEYVTWARKDNEFYWGHYYEASAQKAAEEDFSARILS